MLRASAGDQSATFDVASKRGLKADPGECQSRSSIMLTKAKIALAAMLVSGMALGAATDVADAKSGKSARTPQRSAPVYLDQGGRQQYPNNWRSQNWDGWVPPPARAGGVG
jgi:hypothetical protein